MSVLVIQLFVAALILSISADAHAQSGRARPLETPTPTPSTQTEIDEEVESVDVDLAGILLTAIDRERRFVTTLKRDDVRVTEDGVPQEVTVFQRETDLPLSIALLVDTSASQEGVMEEEKRAALAFLEAVLRPGRDTAAVLSFTGITRLNLPLTSDAQALRSAVEALRVEYTPASPECSEDNYDVTEQQILRCKTAVWDSVYLTAEKVLAQTHARTRRAIILLSDGDDTVSRNDWEEAAEFAVRQNAVVYAVGIRDEKFPHGKLRRDELRKLSERTGGRAFFPRDVSELRAAFAQIDTELRSQYYLAYTPTNRRRDATFRRIRVEITSPTLKKQKLRLLYREGYYAGGRQK